VLKTLAMPLLQRQRRLELRPAGAYGDAPWCAVITIGTGTVYWDCQYPTFEACYHLGNILAGNRGFCNLNPWPGPSQAVPYKLKRHPRY
jgi:hypothetical protein